MHFLPGWYSPMIRIVEVGRLLVLENPVDVAGRAPKLVDEIGTVGDQSAAGDVKTAGKDPRAVPTAVSPKYTNESPGKARMHTCLDQYNANNANGGLKWIQRGGDYYKRV
jgi:hypothetical protein